MHSIQSLKPSVFHLHQEEGFQAVSQGKEKDLVRTRNDVLKLQLNRRKHTKYCCHLQVSVVHTLTVTMSNCVYKLLKVSPTFIFGKFSLVNLYIKIKCKHENFLHQRFKTLLRPPIACTKGSAK